jgi:hypothetical protein
MIRPATLFAVALSLLATGAWADEDRSWHLLTKSQGGTVSLVKGLTKDECEKMKCDVTTPHCDQICGGCSYQIMSGDIEMNDAECFQ